VPIGIISAVGRGGWFNNMMRILSVFFNAIPVFWLGLLLILVFNSWLRILPPGSQCRAALSGGCPPVYQRLNYLLLPAIVLASSSIATYSRFMRAAMLEAVNKDYIRTAQAKGLSTDRVLIGHALKNAAVPIVTIIGVSLALLISVVVVTETVFAIPGLGRLTVDAILRRDYPIIQGIILVFSAAYVLVNLLVDLSYTFLDPRIRY